MSGSTGFNGGNGNIGETAQKLSETRGGGILFAWGRKPSMLAPQADAPDPACQ